MSIYKKLFEEDNVISLRTATISDNDDLVVFRLTPKWFGTSIPVSRARLMESASQDCAWLYRHMRSATGEAKLSGGIPCIQQNILAKETPALFKLLWSDSGHGTLVYVDGEPWAFIDERTHLGYSKGILKNTLSKSMTKKWDQELFEKLFVL
jgi:hypothetical protein